MNCIMGLVKKANSRWLSSDQRWLLNSRSQKMEIFIPVNTAAAFPFKTPTIHGESCVYRSPPSLPLQAFFGEIDLADYEKKSCVNCNSKHWFPILGYETLRKSNNH